MKILVVGGGGREHAICKCISESKREIEMYAAPGNPGIGKLAQCVDIKADNVSALTEFAVSQSIDLVVVGPEVPLTMGIADMMQEKGIRVFGPNKKCARLEGSKSFTKKFLLKHNIPTAGYKEFTDKESLLEAVGIYGYPMVLKADGLAAGKGVIIAENEHDARIAIEEMMGEKKFGDAGNKVVVEEFLTGREASCLCFVDHNTIVPMASAQDYKRIFDGDKGPNTGGMGTYSPNVIFDEALEEKIKTKILIPTLEGFKKDGLDFQGVLFIGLMIKDGEPKVIEFNTRFGDPEAESILLRLDSDLAEIMEAVLDNRLREMEIKWNDDAVCCIVMASAGYPGSYTKGAEIKGLDSVDSDVCVFHAGTKLENGKTVTAGGRVLAVTARAKTLEEARCKALANVEKISFKGSQYRRDIGAR